ncbi:hypothetical protein ACQKDB_15125 [Planococcus kocurii]|uniref:Uncharacterized protein n=1 Tax=Planococcus kocurii TaxID=1374 RepID=A0ABM5WW34_9BACL|nr:MULTISPECIES: hypothetical protein [Planococcus]ALS78533.1 hypothetical protein AUO94_07605 [Planococcus kocurii]KAA0956411.1 hypothetical protein FQ085_12965 [Planococcus sp. ANT_H30]
MRKLFKTSGQLIIGALVGFFGMPVLLEADFRIDLSGYAFIGNTILLTLAALLTLFHYIVISAFCLLPIKILLEMKKMLRKDVCTDSI